ncbi:unnamed protein product [Somion occarium]|uniref:LIM zinc-binding domain-containing protein n=1 Tax=Somion occarium TaxID=3059160 RepID=A0ABP1CTJ2_9APHY
MSTLLKACICCRADYGTRPKSMYAFITFSILFSHYDGEQLYHKPCLACTSCGKRLDSYSLVEHNQQPFCKQCHVKNFGTRDLRHANLPDRDDVLGLSPPTSPTRSSTHLPSLPPRMSPSPSTPATSSRYIPSSAPPVRRTATGQSTGASTQGFNMNGTTSPRLQSTRTFSPPPPQRGFSPSKDLASNPTHTDGRGLVRAPSPWEDEPSSSASVSASTPTCTPTPSTKPANGIPRTIPLSSVISPPSSPTKSAFPPRVSSPFKETPRVSMDSNRPISPSSHSHPPGSFTPSSSASTTSHTPSTPIRTITVPLIPTSTGIRYGAALGGGSAYGSRSGGLASPTGGKFGGSGGFGGTPTCAKCGKMVYFAEQRVSSVCWCYRVWTLFDEGCCAMTV